MVGEFIINKRFNLLRETGKKWSKINIKEGDWLERLRFKPEVV